MVAGDTYKSVITSEVKGRIFRRGGARKRTPRASNILPCHAVDALSAAIVTARDLGLPFNRMITIHWERAGIVPGEQSARATARYLKYARDMLGKGRDRFVYLWVRENDEGDGSKGDHVHILCHVPVGRSFGNRQRRWIRFITGRPYRAGVIHTRRIGRRANLSETAPQLYAINLLCVADYILKGGSHGDVWRNGFARWGEGGVVVGRRWDICRNLLESIRIAKIA